MAFTNVFVTVGTTKFDKLIDIITSQEALKVKLVTYISNSENSPFKLENITSITHNCLQHFNKTSQPIEYTSPLINFNFKK